MIKKAFKRVWDMFHKKKTRIDEGHLIRYVLFDNPGASLPELVETFGEGVKDVLDRLEKEGVFVIYYNAKGAPTYRVSRWYKRNILRIEH